jgi:hypothetical protein
MTDPMTFQIDHERSFLSSSGTIQVVSSGTIQVVGQGKSCFDHVDDASQKQSNFLNS